MLVVFYYLCHVLDKKTTSKSDKNNMAKKENRDVIQSYLITTAKYEFSVDEKRILSHLIECMQPLLEGKKLKGKVEKDLFGNYSFRLPISFFMDENPTIKYSRVKDALRSLNEKSIEYEDDNVWQICRLIEMPKLDKRGEVEFYLSDKLVDAFLNFNKGYSKYQLEVSLSFKSVYSMRLYELISNQKQPLTFRISKLKEMWGVNSTAYDRNYNFIQKIIVQAKKELDEKANWTFDFIPLKNGRAFDRIQFIPIHQYDKESEEVTRAEAIRQVNLSFFVDRETKDYLKNTCGFSPREIKNNAETIEKFSKTFSNLAAEKIREIWGRARNAKNPKGYLIGTMKLEIDNK